MPLRVRLERDTDGALSFSLTGQIGREDRCHVFYMLGRALDATETCAEAWRMLDSTADDLQPGRAMEATIEEAKNGNLVVYGPTLGKAGES